MNPAPDLIGSLTNPNGLDLSPHVIPSESLYLQLTVRAFLHGGIEKQVNVLAAKGGGLTTSVEDARPFNTPRGANAKAEEIKRGMKRGVLKSFEVLPASKLDVTREFIHFVG